LLVRRNSDGFELIAGERRLRAAQRLGMESVPVVVRDVNDAEMLELALIENIQRENLNPIEEARAYRRLIDEFDLTQEEVAARVIKRSWLPTPSGSCNRTRKRRSNRACCPPVSAALAAAESGGAKISWHRKSLIKLTVRQAGAWPSSGVAAGGRRPRAAGNA
jgi:hypothetical protein